MYQFIVNPINKPIHSVLKGLMNEHGLVLKPTEMNAIIDVGASISDMTLKAVT